MKTKDLIPVEIDNLNNILPIIEILPPSKPKWTVSIPLIILAMLKYKYRTPYYQKNLDSNVQLNVKIEQDSTQGKAYFKFDYLVNKRSFKNEEGDKETDKSDNYSLCENLISYNNTNNNGSQYNEFQTNSKCGTVEKWQQVPQKIKNQNDQEGTIIMDDEFLTNHSQSKLADVKIQDLTDVEKWQEKLKCGGIKEIERRRTYLTLCFPVMTFYRCVPQFSRSCSDLFLVQVTLETCINPCPEVKYQCGKADCINNSCICGLYNHKCPNFLKLWLFYYKITKQLFSFIKAQFSSEINTLFN
ncbi:hypothetical protein ABPG72_000514 [Tetrahymena utriculariae]